VIVELTGNETACPPLSNAGNGHQNPGKFGWNQFATNGLSYDALVGVLADLTGPGGEDPEGETAPMELDVCRFLEKVNEHKKVKRTDLSWPVFEYRVSSFKLNSRLTLRSTRLDCAELLRSQVVI